MKENNTNQIEQEYFKAAIIAKYNTITSLENELSKVEKKVEERQKDISLNIDKYKEKDILDIVNKEQFYDINFKLNTLIQDINFSKTEMYLTYKVCQDIRVDIDIPNKVEEKLLEIEGQFYKPAYAVIEGNVELIDEDRKKAFQEHFTSEEINQEMKRLMKKYSDLNG